MTWLKYYEEENKRWPELHASRPSHAEAEETVALWIKTIGLKPIKVRWTRGNRVSRASGRSILLNDDYLSWLLVAHEFAHSWCDQQPQGMIMRHRAHFHNKEHADRVDLLCRRLAKDHIDIAHAVALREERERRVAERTAMRAAARPPEIESRIQVREAQVARLRRRIKGLTTRLKTAERSLAALRRRSAKSSV